MSDVMFHAWREQQEKHRKLAAARAASDSYLYGADLVGATFIDLGSETKKMNALKSVTVEVAQTLCKYGIQIINEAISASKQAWYRPDLPGEASRAGVLGHLQWHDETLSRLSLAPTAPYQSAADLKKWVLQSYIESNAVQEGSASASYLWAAMWQEIETKLASYPKAILKAAADVANKAVEGVTGLPVWAWLLIGTGGVAGLGFVAYKTGILREVAVRRLGGGR